MARALAALTIGPLEPRGQDGVLADVMTFSALGLHATVVVTAIDEIAVEAALIAAQVEAVLGSVHVDAVALTCPEDATMLEAIAGLLVRHDVQMLVLDPAAAVFDARALEVIKARLLPLALVAVPNIPEAQALTGLPVETWEDMREAAHAIAAMGAANVVIKGGKRAGDHVTDLLFDGSDYRDVTAQRVQPPTAPGAGTTFAAALAASLAKGETVQHSVAAAKAYVTKALQDAYDLGGPAAMHHFYRYWRPSAPWQ